MRGSLYEAKVLREIFLHELGNGGRFLGVPSDSLGVHEFVLDVLNFFNDGFLVKG